ncbi:MAG: adenylate kinase [Christensenellales bacterium]|jgi:adenylate kinase
MKIILLGPPGAGKGTQAANIVRDYQVAHISTGDILRANLREQTELGKKAKAFMDAGELVPDDLIISMVEDRLAQPDCENGYLLDGFPRTLAQAAAFDKNNRVDAVINIAVPAEQLVSRIAGRRMCGCGATYHVKTYDKDTCGRCGEKLYQRDDDKEETVKNRLSVYEAQTAPLIDHYGDKVKTVDGMKSIEEVYDDIRAILGAI